MDPLRIPTKSLLLVLQTREATLAQVERMPPEVRAEISSTWLAAVKESKRVDPWIHGFVMVHRASNQEVGRCGFNGAPGTDGMVEIAYGVSEDFQGRGYATEAAEALTAYALGQSDIRGVRAHTLPQSNASTRVLTKCGFRRIGEVMDPEDGRVWRWEKP